MDRFMYHVQKLEDGCWIWTGAKCGNGYGYFWSGEKLVRAPRWMLSQKLDRPVDPKMHCCHHCDTPECVNPDHLYEGTPKQNRQDTIRRGRLNPQGAKGMDNAKVRKAGTGPKKAKKIKKYLKTHSRSEAAAKFGLHVSTIRKIDMGTHWTQNQHASREEPERSRGRQDQDSVHGR